MKVKRKRKVKSKRKRSDHKKAKGTQQRASNKQKKHYILRRIENRYSPSGVNRKTLQYLCIVTNCFVHLNRFNHN